MQILNRKLKVGVIGLGHQSLEDHIPAIKASQDVELTGVVEVALIREAKEETGLDIDVLMPFSVFDYQIETPEKIKDSVQILSQLSGIGQKTAHEMVSCQFFDLEDVVKKGVPGLLNVQGIGKDKAEKIFKEAKKIMKK